MTVGRTISDLARIHKAGRTDVELFQDELGSSKKHLGDLRMEAWGHEGERAHLAEAYQDQKSPVNELRMEAMADGHWPLAQPSGIKNAAFHADAERIESETLLQDTFDRANGALGSVPGPGDPVAWQNATNWAIVDGRSIRQSGGTQETWVETGAADGYVEVLVTPFDVTGQWTGPVFRLADASNYLYVAIPAGSTNVDLLKVDGGSGSYIAGFGPGRIPTLGTSYRIGVAFKGGIVRVFLNGEFLGQHVLSAGDYTKFGANTKCGIRCTGSNVAYFDNFTVRTLDPQADLAAAVDTFDRSTAAEIIDLSGTRAGGTGTALRLPGTTGNSASCPSSGAFNIAGNVDLRVEVALANWTTTQQRVLSRWGAPPNRSFSLLVNSGNVAFYFSTDGTAQVSDGGKTIGAVSPGQRLWLRVVRVASTGAITYYRSDDGIVWTDLGTNVNTSGALATSTAVLEAGASDAGSYGNIQGRVHKVEVRNGIDGTVVASPDFTNKTAGTTSFNDSQGNLWSINQSHGANFGSTETGQAAALPWTSMGGSTQIVNGRVTRNEMAVQARWINAGIADYDISIQTMLGTADSSGVVVRRVDDSNFLTVDLYTTSNRVRIRDAGAAYATLAEQSVTAVVPTQWYTLRVVGVGDRMWVYLDGVLVLTYTLSGAQQTKYGAATGCGIRFFGTTTTLQCLVDNFRVSRPPLVAVWPDLSGKHRHAVQTTLAKQPVLLSNIKNGRAVVRFDGVDDALLRTFASDLSQPNTVAVAFQMGSVGSDRAVMDGNGGSNRHKFSVGVDTKLYFGAGAGAAPAINSGATTIAASTWYQATAVANTTAGRLRLGGTQLAAGDVGAHSMNGVAVGSGQGGTFSFMHGDIGELVIANANLEATGELTAAENYLIRRWT